MSVAFVLAMGVFAGYFCYLPAMYGFVGGITLTFVLSRLLMGDALHLGIAGILLLTMLFAVLGGRQFNRLLSSEIIMRARNARLVEDLTRKQAEVEAANRAKTQFLAAASHDLRQPVHAINLYNEVLRDHVRSEDGAVVLDRMQQSVRALDGLFESIQDISKFEAGIVTPRITPFALEHVFVTLCAQYGEIAKAKHLILDVPATTHRVLCDITLLERILGNLLSNALRYTETGRVHLEVQQRDQAIVVSVCDTGVGIPQDKLSDIFLEFVQLHNPQRSRLAGLGLGLNIAQRMTKLLDISLEVHSEVGRGSRFSVTLPLAQSQDLIDTGASGALVPHEFLHGLMVAIIDDDDDVRQSTELLLKRWGCHVLSASGNDVFAKLDAEERIPDLILCDLRLRDNESGIDLVGRMRAHLGMATPAIIISGDVDPQWVKEAALHGLPLVHKPVTPERLRQAMLDVKCPAGTS